MTRKRIATVLAIVSLYVLFASGCYKGTIVDLNQGLVITENVSFATDILPILEKNCGISGCHVANGIAPDLSTSKAFLSLTTSDYLDLSNPENSELYGLVSGKLSPAMPIGGADPVIAANILAWIQQGAQNN